MIKYIYVLFTFVILQMFTVSAFACVFPASASGTAGNADTVVPITALGYINNIVANGTNTFQVTYTTTGGSSTTSSISMGNGSGLTLSGTVNVGVGGRITAVSTSGNVISFTSSTGASAGTLTVTGGTVSGGAAWLGANAGIVKFVASGSSIAVTGYNTTTANNSSTNIAFASSLPSCSIVVTPVTTGIGNTLTLNASAVDATQVEFFVDGVSVGVDNLTPFSYVGSTALTNGLHTYSGIATFVGGTKTWTATNITINVSVQTKNGTSCAVVNGAAYCWGNNNKGQLGNNTLVSSNQPVAVTGLSSGVTGITVLNDTVCAIHNGAVKCWGNNAFSVLGVTPATLALSKVPFAHPSSFLTSAVTSISGGANHVCARLGGAVRCWGSGSKGQIGSFSNSTTPILLISSFIIDVKAGGNTSCALYAAGVQCWGDNALGQVGNNNAVTLQFATPQTVIGLSGSTTSLSVGLTHACVVVAGATKCWGSNTLGELGTGSLTPTLSRTAISATALVGTSSLVAAGDNVSCATLSTGELRCWGNNSSGQMGQGTTSVNQLTPTAPTGGFTTGVRAAGAGGLNVCAIKLQHIYCWGDNSFGQIGNSAASNPTLSPFQVFGF